MIRRRSYPGNYDRTTWESRQSDVPAQHMAINDPYDPSYQADIGDLGLDGITDDMLASQAGVQPDATTQGGAPPPGATSAGKSFVRYTFDSRPVGSFDWLSPSVPAATSLNTDQTGTFVVPQGYIGICKQVWFNATAAPAFAIDVNGMPTNNWYATIFVNGIPVKGLTLVDISEFFPGGGAFECFILMQPGDTLTGQVFVNGVNVMGLTTVIAPGGFKFAGVCIPNDGRNLIEQAGNGSCEPVCLDGATINQLRPAPLVLPNPQGGAPIVVNQNAPGVPAKTCTLPPAVSVLDYLACMSAGGSAG